MPLKSRGKLRIWSRPRRRPSLTNGSNRTSLGLVMNYCLKVYLRSRGQHHRKLAQRCEVLLDFKKMKKTLAPTPPRTKITERTITIVSPFPGLRAGPARRMTVTHGPMYIVPESRPLLNAATVKLYLWGDFQEKMRSSDNRAADGSKITLENSHDFLSMSFFVSRVFVVTLGFRMRLISTMVSPTFPT